MKVFSIPSFPLCLVLLCLFIGINTSPLQRVRRTQITEIFSKSICRAMHRRLSTGWGARNHSAMPSPVVAGRGQTQMWQRENYSGCWQRGYRARVPHNSQKVKNQVSPHSLRFIGYDRWDKCKGNQNSIKTLPAQTPRKWARGEKSGFSTLSE